MAFLMSMLVVLVTSKPSQNITAMYYSVYRNHGFPNNVFISFVPQPFSPFFFFLKIKISFFQLISTSSLVCDVFIFVSLILPIMFQHVTLCWQQSCSRTDLMLNEHCSNFWSHGSWGYCMESADFCQSDQNLKLHHASASLLGNWFLKPLVMASQHVPPSPIMLL